jgi:hypothetical protein
MAKSQTFTNGRDTWTKWEIDERRKLLGEIQIRLNQLALAYVSDDEVTELARWIRDVADQVIEPSVSPLDRQLVLDDDI